MRMRVTATIALRTKSEIKIHIEMPALCSVLYMCQFFIMLEDNAKVTSEIKDFFFVIVKLLWKENILRQYCLRKATISIFFIMEAIHLL